jgi:small GTP-binding protein
MYLLNIIIINTITGNHMISGKIIMLGESGVGKSSMMYKYVYGTVSSSLIATIGLDFHIKNVSHGDNIIKAIIWDTSGLERFRGITTSYIRDADVAILVYDINDYESIESIDNWAKLVKKSSPKTEIIIVGNKVDLKRNVKYDDAKYIALKYNAPFFECSYKMSNLNTVFEEAIKIMHDKKIKNINSKTLDKPVNLSIEKSIKKKSHCDCFSS